MQNELEGPFDQLLEAHCTPAVVRALDAGGSPDALWATLAESGFADALVPQARGGAGLALADVLPLVKACGRHAMPLPFAETLLARALLGHAGHDWADGPLTLEAAAGTIDAETLLTLRAALCVAQIAGAGERVLDMALDHARQRLQFGKPVGSFQAVQHQLSVMAEHASAARMAAQLGFASSTHLPDRRLVAMAMVVAGEAAEVIADGGHAVHGAIGISAEFDLQLYTLRLRRWRVQAGSPSYWARRVGRAWWEEGGRPGGTKRSRADAVGFALDSLAAARF